MRVRLINLFFIVIGTAIGIILSLQIQAQPVSFGSSPVNQLEIQKALLGAFSTEQDELAKKLGTIEAKFQEAQDVITKRSSKQTLKILNHLKELAGLTSVDGEGIRITVTDNPAVTRVNFSSINEDFVQATDLRDLINALFLKDARAVSVNDKRVLPLTPIESVFDSILVDNFQITPPFKVEAIGSSEELKNAMQYIKKRKIQLFIDAHIHLIINPVSNVRSLKYLSLQSL